MKHTVIDRKCKRHDVNMREYSRFRKDTNRVYYYAVCPLCDNERKKINIKVRLTEMST